NRDAAPHLLRNVAPNRGHWLSLRVLERSGRDAMGAVLSITAGSKTLRRDVRSGYSYLAANDPRVHVGLGDVTKVESITVRWADGVGERFGPFEADRMVDIRRGSGIAQ
ncbi:MAG TPA: ASPIC/UnbV domain-containing protein, partial [Vicinamibacterales bacterium]